eukprot:1289593-Pleurochrysis_carterae.AAC.2
MRECPQVPSISLSINHAHLTHLSTRGACAGVVLPAARRLGRPGVEARQICVRDRISHERRTRLSPRCLPVSDHDFLQRRIWQTCMRAVVQT